MAIHSSILAWKIPWTEEPGSYSLLGHKQSDMTERLSTLTGLVVREMPLGAVMRCFPPSHTVSMRKNVDTSAFGWADCTTIWKERWWGGKGVRRKREAGGVLVSCLHISFDYAAATAKSLQSCPTLCQPQRRQPTRLPHPWDSPGKNTGVGCHFLLQCMKVKSESEVTQSCPTLRPRGLQPTRLLHPWDFPGKSTGVGCHCLLWQECIGRFKHPSVMSGSLQPHRL